jgi:hypothetical protein
MMQHNVTLGIETNTSTFTNASVTQSSQFDGYGSSETDITGLYKYQVLRISFGTAGIIANVFVIIVILGFTQVKTKVR